MGIDGRRPRQRLGGPAPQTPRSFMRHGPDASLEWTENKWGGAVKRSPLPRIPSNALAPVVPQRDALPQSPSPLPRMPPGWPWRRGKIRGAKSLEWSKSYAIIINVSSEYLSWSETEEPRLIRSLNLFAPPSCRTKGSTSRITPAQPSCGGRTGKWTCR